MITSSPIQKNSRKARKEFLHFFVVVNLSSSHRASSGETMKNTVQKLVVQPLVSLLRRQGSLAAVFFFFKGQLHVVYAASKQAPICLRIG